MEAIVGVDVAKEKHDCEIALPDGTKRRKQIENSASGFRKLLQHFEDLGITSIKVCMEATGRYGEALAQFMYAHGAVVYVVNPKRIRRFAEALGLLGKSDTADAHAICQYAVSHEERLLPWSPKSKAATKLRDTRMHLVGMQKALRAFENRLDAELDVEVHRSIEGIIQMLSAEIERFQAQALEVILSDQQLSQDAAILRTRLGFGPIIVPALLTYIDFRAFRTGREVARFVGTTAKNEQSGKSLNKRGRISKEGSGDLRGLLWNAARTCKRNDPTIREFAARLRSRGKSEGTINSAIVRKLLVQAHALVTKQTPWNPEYAIRAH